jgi:hypothetical protein
MKISKKKGFTIFRPKEEHWIDKEYRCDLEDAAKLIKRNYEEARYRFRPWTKEEYYNSYLNFQEIEAEKKRVIEEARLEEERKKEEKEEKKRKAELKKANAARELAAREQDSDDSDEMLHKKKTAQDRHVDKLIDKLDESK